jgi:hypothetical protein
MCELEKQPPVDQQSHPALTLLAARPEFFAQHGAVDACYRRRNGKTYGPYYRLRYRDVGCAHCLYLGLAGPLVDRVRQTLHALQMPLRQHRAMLQLQRRVRDALRLDRRRLNLHLHSVGLRLKGFEVRGWRTSPLASLARCAKTGRSLTVSLRLKPFRLPRVRQLRFVPRGRAAKWFRDNRPKLPKLPKPGPQQERNPCPWPPFPASIPRSGHSESRSNRLP